MMGKMNKFWSPGMNADLLKWYELFTSYHTWWQVPFRLTRDIVDGMGVSGVEGIYRRCCEATLSVMRTNKEALLTIIEVRSNSNCDCWPLHCRCEICQALEHNFLAHQICRSSWILLPCTRNNYQFTCYTRTSTPQCVIWRGLWLLIDSILLKASKLTQNHSIYHIPNTTHIHKLNYGEILLPLLNRLC